MLQRCATLLLSAGVASALAAVTAAAQETVHLKLNWPDAVKAKVTVETFIDTTIYGKARKLSDTVTYTLEATALAEGFLVVERDYSVLSQQIDGKMLDQDSAVSVREIGLLPPIYQGEYLVARDGTFLGVHNFVDTYCETNARRFAHLKRNPNIAAEIALCHAKVANKTDPIVDHAHQLALNQAFAEWTRIVSRWLGGEMTESQVYEFESTLPEGVPPEKGIPTTDTSVLVGRSPCKQGGAVDDCVQLQWVSLSDTGSTPRPILDIVAVLSPALLPAQAPSGNPVLGSLRKRTEVRLLTDPETLLPHRVEVIESLQVTVRLNTAGPGFTNTETHSIWTYEYEEPK